MNNVWQCKGCDNRNCAHSELCLNCYGRKEILMVRQSASMAPPPLHQHMSQSTSSSMSMASQGEQEVVVPLSNIVITSNNNILSPPDAAVMSTSATASSSSLQVLSDASAIGGPRFPCTQCERIFEKKAHLKNHITRDHLNDLLNGMQCPYCNHKRFKKYGPFENHITGKHPGQPIPRQATRQAEVVIPVLRPNVEIVTPPPSPRKIRIRVRNVYAPETAILEQQVRSTRKIDWLIEKVNLHFGAEGKLIKNNGDDISLWKGRQLGDCNLADGDLLIHC